jgi:hypothetical protein
MGVIYYFSVVAVGMWFKICLFPRNLIVDVEDEIKYFAIFLENGRIWFVDPHDCYTSIYASITKAHPITQRGFQNESAFFSSQRTTRADSGRWQDLPPLPFEVRI